MRGLSKLMVYQRFPYIRHPTLILFMAPHHLLNVYCVKNVVVGKYLKAFKTTAIMAAKWTVEHTVLTYFEFYFPQRNDFGVYY
jgi:hypothetical protein